MQKLFDISDTRQKLKTLVESKAFDGFIMGLILLNAVDFGLMTSDVLSDIYGGVLFLIDRLCMAIFLLEIMMKLFVYGKRFFRHGWNVFDFAVVAISSLPFVSYFIVLRTFRLFRMFKYMRKLSGLRRLINSLVIIVPNFFCAAIVFGVFIYVFAIISVILYGDVFLAFADIKNATISLLQVFALDAWIYNVAKPVASIFPDANLFFISYVLVTFLIVIAFIATSIADVAFRAKRVASRPQRRNFQKKPTTRP